MFVRIQNGYEIDELHDILISGKQNGDLLSWDSGSLVWKNTKTLSGSYKITQDLTASNISLVVNDTTAEPTISFNGSSSATPIDLKVKSDSSLSFEGTAGTLLYISDNLTSGTIFSVNDAASLPLIEVDANGTVSMAEFAGNVGIGTASPQYKLDVNGTLRASGNSFFQAVSGTTATFSNYISGTTGQFTTVSASVFTGSTGLFTDLTVDGSTLLKSNNGNIELEDNLGNTVLRISGSGGQAAPTWSGFGDYLFALSPDIDGISGYGIFYNKQVPSPSPVKDRIECYADSIFLSTYETSSFANGSSIGLYTSGSFGNGNIIISPQANVGIGTSSPNYKLSVTGTLGVSGVATFSTITASNVQITNLDVDTITAREYYTELVSSSIIYESGSTKFGDTSDDVHSFTGSISMVSGNLTVGAPDENINRRITIHGSSAANKTCFLENTASGLQIGYSIANQNLYFGNSATSWLYINHHAVTAHSFYIGSSEKVRIDSNGNVGIGTTSASTLLHVSGSGTTTLATFETSGNASIKLSRTNVVSTGSATLGVSNLGRFDISADDWITLSPANSTLMTLRENGNVGIGTTNPTYKLDLSGSQRIREITNNQDFLIFEEYRGGQLGKFYESGDAGVLQLGYYGNNVTYLQLNGGVSNGGGGIVGYRNSVAGFNITSNTGSNSYILSDVGIGTTNPSKKLEVSGSDALIHDITVGRGAGDQVTNTTIGYQSLSSNISGLYNVAVGYQSLLTNTTGQNNTAIGFSSLRSNSIGSNNVALGRQALYFNETNNNVGIGYQALYYTNSGANNVAIGYGVMLNNSIGQSNVSVGYQSLYENTSGSYNIAVGFRSLRYNTTVSSNVAVGAFSSYSNTTGVRNTAIGYAAGYSNLISNGNTSIGYESAYYVTGSDNTYVGSLAGRGGNAGGGGASNVAIGSNALYENQSGSSNVAVGYRSQWNNVGNSYNTSIGDNTLQALEGQYADYNTAIGYRAGYVLTTGYGNTFVGDGAGDTVTTGVYNTLIGGYGGTSTMSNHIVLSDGAGNQRLWIDNNGDVGIGTTGPTAKLDVYNGQIRSRTNTNNAGFYAIKPDAYSLSAFVISDGTNPTMQLRDRGSANGNVELLSQNGRNLVVATELNAGKELVLQGSIVKIRDADTPYPDTVWIENNKVGIGTGATPTAKLEVNGDTTISGTLNISGSIIPNGDGAHEIGAASNRFADVYAVQTTVGAVFETGLTTKGIEEYPTGTVLIWREGKLRACDKDEDVMVMGVGKHGKQQPIILGAEPVLVTGKVKEGDWIVTSSKKGHGKALKKRWWKRNLTGKIIAQALESCDGESNLIKCMINKT
jgi:hypothetical protein